MSDTVRSVRVIKIPRGDAPEWVRRQWVGCILPDIGPPRDGVSYGIISGQEHRHRSGFTVPMKQALVILEKKSPEASGWFEGFLGSKVEHGNFIFREDECEPVPDPFPQNTTDHTDLPISEFPPPDDPF